MALPRAISSSLGCNSCRLVIARSSRVTPIANGLSLRASWASPISSPSRHLPRSFTSAAVLRADKDDAISTDAESLVDFEPTSIPEATPASESTPPPPSDPPIPWYLQNRPAPTPQQAAIIPPLPENSPPLLTTLLDYLAITAGLDDITILDLRHLDPPPALGPKLIMIVCTARSEKHLHVSADRFSRHLRREHGLRPNPAGLLGRNELKIKLRRKAKRMKMLANVGGASAETGDQGNLDDGIRTGWICCTVGKIEAHPADTHMPGANVEQFVGFRDVKPGVNVVVQMFTEEKRDEVDLETLWGGVLRTHERQDRRADEALSELDVDDDADADGHVEGRDVQREARRVTKSVETDPEPRPPTRQFRKTQPSAGDEFPSPPTSEPRTQIRRLHGLGLRS